MLQVELLIKQHGLKLLIDDIVDTVIVLLTGVEELMYVCALDC